MCNIGQFLCCRGTLQTLTICIGIFSLALTFKHVKILPIEAIFVAYCCKIIIARPRKGIDANKTPKTPKTTRIKVLASRVKNTELLYVQGIIYLPSD